MKSFQATTTFLLNELNPILMSLGFFHKAKELGHKTERLKPKNFDLIPSQIKVLSVVYFVYMLGAKSIVCFLPIFIESVLSNVSLTGVVVSF